MNNNSTYTKKSELDQFYTAPHIAEMCFKEFLNFADLSKSDMVLEPSAGSGAFFNLLPKKNRVGLDLDPKCSDIIKIDFFNFKPNSNLKNIYVIGNPPFGKNCSVAIKFFNKCAEYSNIIAFIIPNTFKKASLKSKLDLNFKLVKTISLPQNSFVLNGEPYNVPCCFQIWTKSQTKRKIKKVSIENDFFYFSKKNDSDFVIRRVGGRAGKAFLQIDDCSESSNYFLKVKEGSILNKFDLVDLFNGIDFSKTVNSTAGVRSLSKQELMSYFKRKFK